MKKVIIISATTLLALVVIGGLVGYCYLAFQERGMTADGKMVPPASARNAMEAPKFDPSKNTPAATGQKPPECQIPTQFNLPVDLNITTPEVPDGLGNPATPSDAKKG